MWKNLFYMLLYSMFLDFSLQETFFFFKLCKWLALEKRNTEEGRRMIKL